MLGFRYIKVPPTTFVMQFRDGKVRREGSGMSFVYFAPSSTIVAVPVGSTDVPFIFGEVTADFQALTVQGSLTFRVADPRKLAAILDFSLKPTGGYASDDPTKLSLRAAHAAQTATRAEIQGRPLRTAIVEADAIARAVRTTLGSAPSLVNAGLEVLNFSILAIKPVPETSKALEAEARERLLREADDALYSRRNNAVEQERRIKQNELATDVAVVTKQREIEETRISGKIAIEEHRKELVGLESENSRVLSDAQAYGMRATLEPLRTLDPKTLQVLAAGSGDARTIMALAFQDLAANAAKVGNLNISPDLLDSLLRSPEPRNGKTTR